MQHKWRWDQSQFQKLAVKNEKSCHPIVKTPAEVIENVISLAKSMLDKKLEKTIDWGPANRSQETLQRPHLFQRIVRTFQLYLFFQSVEDVTVGDFRAWILKSRKELNSKNPSQSQQTIMIPLNMRQLLLPRRCIKPTRANVLLRVSMTYCFLLWKATVSLEYAKVLPVETWVMSCSVTHHN